MCYEHEKPDFVSELAGSDIVSYGNGVKILSLVVFWCFALG